MTNLLSAIGNTPLIRLPSPNPNVQIFAKAEWLNPGGSVKDRPALYMIQQALTTGKLQDGKTLLDASSGNTAIAYAMISASLGIPVAICLPENSSKERITILQAYGATLFLTPSAEKMDGAIRKAQALATEHPELYYHIDQFNNDDNWRAHYLTTAAEILQQTDSGITHFVAALGTSGTFVGTTRKLKEALPQVQAIAIQPDSPNHTISGVKHMASAIVPGIYDATLADQILIVSSASASKFTRELAKHGIFVGVSSGAAYAGTLQIAEHMSEGIVVVIFPDRGERYLSTDLWLTT